MNLHQVINSFIEPSLNSRGKPSLVMVCDNMLLMRIYVHWACQPLVSFLKLSSRSIGTGECWPDKVSLEVFPRHPLLWGDLESHRHQIFKCVAELSNKTTWFWLSSAGRLLMSGKKHVQGLWFFTKCLVGHVSGDVCILRSPVCPSLFTFCVISLSLLTVCSLMYFF
jgi:hypothetical protein